MEELTNWFEPFVFTYWLFVRLFTVMLPAVMPKLTNCPFGDVIVTLELCVCGAVQSWLTLRYATEEGSTALGIPDTMLDPVKLVIPEPLPVIMPPLLTMRLVETVTLDINICAAVQVLVEERSELALAALTHVGAAPLPFDCRTWPLEPAAPLAISVPLRVSELPATIEIPLPAPSSVKMPELMCNFVAGLA